MTKKRRPEPEVPHVHCERHAELELIVEHSPDPIVTIDEHGVVLQWNAAASALFGWSPEEALGRLVSELIVPPRMRAAHAGGLARLRAGAPLKLTGPLSLEAVGKDGAPLPIELRLSEFKTAKGRRFTGIIRDRRDQVELLEHFEQNRAILGGVLAQVPAAIWQTDRELRFTRMFGTALNTIGLDPDTTVGTSLQELFKTDDENFEPIRKHRACLETGEDQQYGVRFRETEFQVSLSPITTHAGEILGVYGVGVDVTDRLRDERRLSWTYNAFNNSPHAIHIVDLETARFIEVNDTACSALGFSREELLTMTPMDIDPNIDSLKRFREVCAAEIPGTISKFTSWNLRKDGTSFPVQVSLNVIQDEFGDYVCAIVEDITERNRIEQILKDSELRYRSLFRDSAAAMIQLEPVSGKILDANAAAVKFYGYPAEDLLRMTLAELSDEPAERVKLHLAAFDHRQAKALTMRHKHQSGLLKDVEMFSGPVTIGNRRYLLAIVHDISARRRAQRDLNLLKTAIDAADEAVVITDAKATILIVNPAFERMTGYRASEAVGENPRILKSGKHAAVFYQRMWERLLAGEVWTGKIVNKRKDGSLYNQDTSITPVRDANGAITHFIAIDRDATDEVKLQERMAASERLAATGTLAAGVAHEINNPLSVILGLSQILSEETSIPEALREDVRTIAEQARRAGRITQGMLRFSRTHQPHKTPVQVRALIEQLHPLVAYDFKRRGVRLKAELPDGELRINADSDQIQQILLNLLINAKQAMEDSVEKEIRLSVSADADSVVIAIRDTGCGMEPETLRRVFDPFFTTKAVGVGTGLGLAISYAIAVDHGGTLEVDSAPGKGSEFRLILPLHAGS